MLPFCSVERILNNTMFKFTVISSYHNFLISIFCILIQFLEAGFHCQVIFSEGLIGLYS